jgi:hypothetical protein
MRLDNTLHCKVTVFAVMQPANHALKTAEGRERPESTYVAVHTSDSPMAHNGGVWGMQIAAAAILTGGHRRTHA